MAGCTSVLEAGGIEATRPAFVVEWNRIWLDVIRQWPQPAVAVARQAACLNVTLFDTLNAIAAARGERHFEHFHAPHEKPSPDTSRLAAVGAAAHTVLSELFPVSTDIFDTRLAATLEFATAYDRDIPAGKRFGESVANEVLTARADDGHDDPEIPPYRACNDPKHNPGCWRGLARDGVWASAHYATVDTWVIDTPNGTEFGRPPALESNDYAEAWHEVYAYDYSGDVRAEDEVIAGLWSGGRGAITPAGRWMQIAMIVTEKRDLPMLEIARLLARLGVGMADAGICVWKAKYNYGFWRPKPAIHHGDADGNPETVSDRHWEPLHTGISPEYPSGLACFGAVASELLVDTFGSVKLPFEITSFGTSERTMSFAGVGDAFEESCESRIRFGSHFRFSVEDAIPVGRNIANRINTDYAREQ